jgi:branched-chain amino acid transport system permease protein/urea transport system permease protein
VLIAPLTVVIAQMGVNHLARSFFVVILGGAGSVAGAAAAARSSGVETVLNYQVPVTVSQALVLVLAIVIVRFRPQGLIPA